MSPFQKAQQHILAEKDHYMPNEQGRALSDSAMVELEQMMKQAAADGIREGLKSVIADDEVVTQFWNQGIKVAKDQAKMSAGSLLFDSFSGFFKAVGRMAIVGMIVYYIGGWELLSNFVKTVLIGGPK